MIKNLATILAILLIIISAGAICAASNTGIDTNSSPLSTDHVYISGTVLKNTNNTSATPYLGVAPIMNTSQNHNDDTHGSVNKTSLNNNCTNDTQSGVNSSAGVIIKSIDAPTKVVSAGSGHNASGNISPLQKQVTGNPILGLVCMSSVLVSCVLFRRKWV